MKLLTIGQTAKFLNVSYWTVRRLTAKGLPFHRIGRKLMFKELDLENWLKTKKEVIRQYEHLSLTNSTPVIIYEDGGVISELVKSKTKTRHVFDNGAIFKRKTKSKKVRFYVEFYNAENRRVRKVIKNATSFEEAKAALDREVQKAIDVEYGIRREREKISFNDFCDKYLENYSKTNKRSWKTDRSYLKTMRKFFSGYYLKEISSQDIERYKRERLKQGVKQSTVNRCLAILRKMLNLAAEWRYLPEDRKIKFKLFPEKDNFMERILTEEEEKRLMYASSELVKLIITVALNTGMRKGELLSLKWSEVDLRAKRVKIEKTKSRKIRYVPINSTLLDEFLKLRSRNGQSPYLFFNEETGKPYLDVKKGFKAACRRANIKGLRFHDLRHTFATRLMEKGVDIITLKELLGHSTVKITERYTHPSQESKRKAVELLNARLSDTDKILKKLARI